MVIPFSKQYQLLPLKSNNLIKIVYNDLSPEKLKYMISS
jgi:hypothetical protein